MTIRRHRAHLDNHAVGESGMLPSDRRRFLQSAHEHLNIAANRLFGFRERAIRNARTAGARDDPCLRLQRLTLRSLARCRERAEPIVPPIDQVLFLLGRKMIEHLRTGIAKQQHVRDARGRFRGLHGDLWDDEKFQVPSSTWQDAVVRADTVVV